MELNQEEREAVESSAQGGADPRARRAQLKARLERQQQLYELGDWTRDRYLQARAEVLAEIAETERALPQGLDEMQQLTPDVLERLGAYVREVRAAWSDASKANKRLLVRTLFEQLWVVGDRIVAAKPVAQVAPFVRLLQGTAARGVGMGVEREDNGMDLLYLDPSSAWTADTSSVAALTEKSPMTVHVTGEMGWKYGQADPTGVPRAAGPSRALP